MTKEKEQKFLQQSQTLEQCYFSILSQVKEMSRKASRKDEPTLLAVSKKHSIEKIKRLYLLGHRRFGENYTQELLEKAEQLSQYDIEFVYIGRIQSNKIKKIVSVAKEIQSVHSLKHAQLIEKAAISCGKIPFPVYIEVNVDDEISKGGITPEEVPEFYAQLKRQCPNLSIQGIMSLPSQKHQRKHPSISELPNAYVTLKQLAKKVGDGKLSLGTSQDMDIAIAAGSTEVRIGTALFGPRIS